jgi:hypothetical protein
LTFISFTIRVTKTKLDAIQNYVTNSRSSTTKGLKWPKLPETEDFVYDATSSHKTAETTESMQSG